jgi:hypothetical protein
VRTAITAVATTRPRRRYHIKLGEEKEWKIN